MESVDTVVIGAGVVGLAVAAELAARGFSPMVLEAEPAFGTGISSRNSEVIHAGIYYPAGSLKARLCVEGRELLYRYCESNGVGHRRCGKLIVAATAAEHEQLAAVGRAAAANGVDDLRWLEADEARALEPALACSAALLSPSTGIVDSHGLMLSLLARAEAGGGQLATGCRVTAIEARGGGIEVDVDSGSESMRLRASRVVNCAGLGAVELAAGVTGARPGPAPTLRLARGVYFSLSGARAPFSHLIYPAPIPGTGGLGVHLTLDLAGAARFGPDVEWIDEIDYRVDPRRAEGFYEAIRRYWPDLPDGTLAPAYAGIRPKLHGPGEPAADFLIQGAEAHGVDGLVNLLGIESPGLTSSLAIADFVADRLA
ncbi:MAG: NAD(P)/FAD-dependent oxidoreductase [Pseudomonadota bacterium]|nr:NAD(P)/FAD-dependent oxidoreductase [Pseudomonadota bacterium]